MTPQHRIWQAGVELGSELFGYQRNQTGTIWDDTVKQKTIDSAHRGNHFVLDSANAR